MARSCVKCIQANDNQDVNRTNRHCSSVKECCEGTFSKSGQCSYAFRRFRYGKHLHQQVISDPRCSRCVAIGEMDVAMEELAKKTSDESCQTVKGSN